MHIYAFGSICRGEIDINSDTDILIITDNAKDVKFNNQYSIYSYKRIKELWERGNAFAWHLTLESKLLFSSDKKDFIYQLGHPNIYSNGLNDCLKFNKIYQEAHHSLINSKGSEIFDLSIIFLAIRDFSISFSLHFFPSPIFSRNAAKKLGKFSLDIEDDVYKILERSKILCSRGLGNPITDKEIEEAKKNLLSIDLWMNKLISLF